MKIFNLFLCAVVLISLVVTNALASTVTVVSPFAVGGGADTMARLLQKTLSTCMPSRTFLVESRPGASGEIAARYVVNSRDTTRLLLATPSLVTSNLKKNEHYDLEHDLEPVFFLGYIPLVLVTNTKNNWKSLNDILMSEKSLTYGSAGTGTTSHLNGVELGKIMKQNSVHVPYKGVVNTIPDLISGMLDFSFLFGNNVVPLMRSNQLRPLAIIGEERSLQLPNVPTFKELGHSSINFNTWFMLLANRGADATVLREVKVCLQKTLMHPKESFVFKDAGLQYNSQDFFQGERILQNEIQKYRNYLIQNPLIFSM